MRIVLFVSRHAPTRQQIAELKELTFADEVRHLLHLGSRNLTMEYDLEEYMKALREAIRTVLTQGDTVAALAGVFPSPVQCQLTEMAIQWADLRQSDCKAINVYSSWNAERTPEGASAPTFKHYKFVLIGKWTDATSIEDLVPGETE